MADPQRTRENLEGLPVDLIDDLRAAHAARHERRGWAYDPEWTYFVHDGASVQSIATRESVHGSPEWSAQMGLDRETVEWLVAHPTPGAYRSAKR